VKNIDVKNHIRQVACMTPVQALRAAHAVNEARIIVLLMSNYDLDINERLRELEREFYREAQQLKRKTRKCTC